MKQLLTILGIVILFGLLQPVSGQAVVNEEPEVAAMMNNFISKHKTNDAIRGWRIQIITTDNRRKMEAARSKFSTMYPETPIKWQHESPYYKVQIGAYEKKIDLQGFLLSLKEDFPTAIPVLDDIYKSELISN
jgi:hypothetical protein